ncbi:unnamed protein product [Merluccius merluccius]
MERRMELSVREKLQPIDELFLFLIYLSTGYTQRDLGHRFHVHRATDDKEVFRKSGITSLLTPDMAIMVDKGFLVDGLVPGTVHRPAFLSKRNQIPEGATLSQHEQTLKEISHNLRGLNIAMQRRLDAQPTIPQASGSTEATAVVQSSPPRMSREPHLPSPERYDGRPQDCREFFNTVFSGFQPTTFILPHRTIPRFLHHRPAEGSGPLVGHRRGLSEEMKDELTAHELPLELDALIDLALRKDSRCRERRREQRETTRGNFRLLPSPTSTYRFQIRRPRQNPCNWEE